MSNADSAFGMAPVNNPDGSAPLIRTYDATTTRHIYRGQLVVLETGSASADALAEGWDGSTNETTFLGVAAHYRGTGDADRSLAVYADPDQEYEIQVDDDSSPTFPGQADFVGAFFPILNGAAGSSTTLDSTAELDGSGGSATITNLEVQGVRIVTDPRVDYSSVNQRVIVKIPHALHVFGSGGGVAPGS